MIRFIYLYISVLLIASCNKKPDNVKCTQLVIKGGRDSQFRKDHKIICTPKYILIDKEGKFIDARASRPSEDLRELLDKIL